MNDIFRNRRGLDIRASLLPITYPRGNYLIPSDKYVFKGLMDNNGDLINVDNLPYHALNPELLQLYNEPSLSDVYPNLDKVPAVRTGRDGMFLVDVVEDDISRRPLKAVVVEKDSPVYYEIEKISQSGLLTRQAMDSILGIGDIEQTVKDVKKFLKEKPHLAKELENEGPTKADMPTYTLEQLLRPKGTADVIGKPEVVYIHPRILMEISKDVRGDYITRPEEFLGLVLGKDYVDRARNLDLDTIGKNELLPQNVSTVSDELQPNIQYKLNNETKPQKLIKIQNGYLGQYKKDGDTIIYFIPNNGKLNYKLSGKAAGITVNQYNPILEVHRVDDNIQFSEARVANRLLSMLKIPTYVKQIKQSYVSNNFTKFLKDNFKRPQDQKTVATLLNDNNIKTAITKLNLDNVSDDVANLNHGIVDENIQTQTFAIEVNKIRKQLAEKWSKELPKDKNSVTRATTLNQMQHEKKQAYDTTILKDLAQSIREQDHRAIAKLLNITDKHIIHELIKLLNEPTRNNLADKLIMAANGTTEQSLLPLQEANIAIRTMYKEKYPKLEAWLNNKIQAQLNKLHNTQTDRSKYNQLNRTTGYVPLPNKAANSSSIKQVDNENPEEYFERLQDIYQQGEKDEYTQDYGGYSPNQESASEAATLKLNREHQQLENELAQKARETTREGLKEHLIGSAFMKTDMHKIMFRLSKSNEWGSLRNHNTVLVNINYVNYPKLQKIFNMNTVEGYRRYMFKVMPNGTLKRVPIATTKGQHTVNNILVTFDKDGNVLQTMYVASGKNTLYMAHIKPEAVKRAIAEIQLNPQDVQIIRKPGDTVPKILNEQQASIVLNQLKAKVTKQNKENNDMNLKPVINPILKGAKSVNNAKILIDLQELSRKDFLIAIGAAAATTTVIYLYLRKKDAELKKQGYTVEQRYDMLRQEYDKVSETPRNIARLHPAIDRHYKSFGM